MGFDGILSLFRFHAGAHLPRRSSRVARYRTLTRLPQADGQGLDRHCCPPASSTQTDTRASPRSDNFHPKPHYMCLDCTQCNY